VGDLSTPLGCFYSNIVQNHYSKVAIRKFVNVIVYGNIYQFCHLLSLLLEIIRECFDDDVVRA
jgi:hypothetical protein